MTEEWTTEKHLVYMRCGIITICAICVALLAREKGQFAGQASSLIALGLVSLAYCVSTLLVMERVSQGAFHNICFIIDLAIATTLVWLTGKTDKSPFVFIYYLLIISNALSRTHRMSIGSSIIISLICTIIFLTERIGVKTPAPLGPFVFKFAMFYGFGALGYMTEGLRESEKIEQDREKDLLLDEAYKMSRDLVKSLEGEQSQHKEKARRLSTLRQISHMMATTRNPVELRQLIVSKSREETNSSMGFLMLIDDDGMLRMDYSEGLSEMSREVFECRVGEGVLGNVAQKGSSVCLGPKDKGTRLAEFLGTKEKINTLLAVPLQTSQDVKPFGVLGVTNLLVGQEYTPEHLNFMEILAVDAAIWMRHAKLINDLQRSIDEITQALAQAIEAKDPYTHGHIERVRGYSLRIAKALKLSEKEKEIIAKSAILHDVGKIATPDNILLKPAALAEGERKTIQQHAVASMHILEGITSLHPKVLSYVLHHHERHDGTGYPDGKRMDEIPLGSQIIAVADAFDAMTTDRPYRQGFSTEEALERLKACSGTQFNPRVVNAFVSVFTLDLKNPKLELKKGPREPEHVQQKRAETQMPEKRKVINLKIEKQDSPSSSGSLKEDVQ